MRVGADLSDLEKATDKVKGHFAKLEQVRKSEAANRQDGLTQELDKANQKVQELKKQYRELVGGMGQADTEKGLLKQLREVESQMNQVRAPYDAIKAAAESAGAEADKLTQKYKALIGTDYVAKMDKQLSGELASTEKQLEALVQNAANYVKTKNGSKFGKVDLKFDNEEARAAFEALTIRADELKKRISQWRINPAMTEEAKALREQIGELRAKAAEPIEMKVEDQQQLEQLKGRANGLYDKVKEIRLNPAATPEAQALAEKLREAYKNTADLQKELNDANGDAAAAGVGKGTSLKAKTLDGLAAAGNGVKAVMGGIGSVAAKGLGLVAKGAKAGANALKNFLGKQAQKAWGHIKNLANGIGSAVNLVKSLGSGIGRLAKRITSLAASALVFNALSKGFQAVQQGIAGVVESDSQLKASLAGIQGSLLTAFAPLWQTILPMVRAVTAALASLAGMIAQVMAALFGTTTSAAQKSASAYYKQAAAAGSSTSASKKAREEAKKAKRDAADFDILHKVDKSTDSGGGSGGITPNFATNLGKTTPFVDQLAQAIKDDDWYKVGTMFAEKLNDAMDKMPWGKIRNTAHKWALNIADTLNGFVETLDWGLVGSTLGNGLNTALDFLDTFAQNFHWDSLGQGIGNGLEGVRQSIDWAQLGRFMADGLKGVLEGLHGLVQSGFNWRALGDDVATAINSAWNNIDWSQAAVDGSKLVRGILQSASNAIAGTDWGKIGQDVAKAIKSIDWGGILADLVEFIATAAGAACKGFGEFFTELFDGLGDKMHDYFGDIGNLTIEGFFEGVTEMVKDIAGWIKEHVVDPWVKGWRNALGIHSPSTVMKELGGYTIQGFLDGITETWETVTSWVSDHLSGLADSFVTWKDNVGQTVSDWASDTKQSVQTWISDTATNVGSWVSDRKQDFESWAGTTGQTVSGWANDTKQSVQTWISDTATNVGGWVSDRKQDFESWASTTGQTVSGWANTARQTIAGWGNDSKGSVVDFSNNARATLEAYSTMTQQTLSSWKAIAVGVFTTFGDNAKDAVRGAVDAIGGTLQGMVSDAMNWGRDFIQNFIDGIKERMSGLLDSVKEMAEQVSSYLHFSVPDTGPLADADTWMPDFMQLLAEGVEKNTPTLLNRVQNAARQISAAYNDLNAPAVAVAGSVTMRTDPMKRMDRGTDDMIATLRSGFNAVCKAVEDKDSSVYMDGDKVEDKTAKSRKKKARLYGHD